MSPTALLNLDADTLRSSAREEPDRSMASPVERGWAAVVFAATLFVACGAVAAIHWPVTA